MYRLNNVDETKKLRFVVFIGGFKMDKKEMPDINSDCGKSYLTFRQKEVLEYLRKGLLNKQIAHAMGLSVSTIKLHISGIFIRLNVNTRTAAVVKAQELGLI